MDLSDPDVWGGLYGVTCGGYLLSRLVIAWQDPDRIFGQEERSGLPRWGFLLMLLGTLLIASAIWPYGEIKKRIEDKRSNKPKDRT